MRLWSIHPSYLDSKGLVALWREGLLAQKVLQGKTKGYKNHPQLNRFKEHSSPVGAMALYLNEVHKEAERRSFNFDLTKIAPFGKKITPIDVTKGQIEFELKHLCQKLEKRDPTQLKNIQSIKKNLPHPSFNIVNGPVADWEKI